METDTSILSLRDVQYRWPGRASFALEIPDFQLALSESVLLLGESGSGKLTLLSLICGTIIADLGTVKVAGTDIASLLARKRDRFRAEHIGLIFQQFNLLPYASVLDNILLLRFAPPSRPPTRAQGRDELHAWILDQVSVGYVTDCATMIETLTEAGFDIPRAGKAYLTAQDPDTGERWRLKGDIFHEDWQVDTAEREAERGTGHDQAGLRRLDGIPIGELQDRFEKHCDHRASYNRERYPHLSATEQELADDLALADHGDTLGGDRLDDAVSLLWTLMLTSSELTDLGLTRIDREDGT